MPIPMRYIVPLLFSNQSFLPTDLGSDLVVAWYDAADATTLYQESTPSTLADADNDVIGYWGDKSGNGYHITQGTTAAKPIFKVNIQNGKPTVRFVSNDALTNLSFLDFDDIYSVYVVAMNDSSGSADASQAIMEVSNGTFNTGFGLFHENEARFLARDSVGAQIAVGVDVRDSVFRLHRAVVDGSTAYFINESAQTPDTYTGSNPNTLSELRVGDSLLAYRHIGDIGEMIICKGDVTTEQNTQIVDYLNTKWGI